MAPRQATSVSPQWANLVLFVAVVMVAVLYAAFPSYRYFPDSLDYAFNMETGSAWIVHPHHPLVPLLPQMVYRLLGGVSSGLAGLDVLLVWSIAVSVLSCWGVIMLLRAGRLATATALVGFALFAFSRGVWYFAVTPNQHSTGLVLNVFALLAMVLALERSSGGPSRGQVIAIGLLTSLAIHTTKLNAGLVLPAAYVMLAGNAPVRRRIADFLGYLAIVIVVGGGLFLFLGVGFAGLRTLPDFLEWQRSYVFLARWWPNDLMDAIQRNWYGAIELHLASVFSPYGLFGQWREGFGTTTWLAWLPAKIGQAIVLLFLAIETIRALIEWYRARPRPRLQTLGLIAALPAILFSCVYTPEWINCRILYLPGFLLFLMPALERHFGLTRPTIRRTWPLLLVIVSLFAINFGTKVLLEANPENNPYLAEAIKLEDTLGPGDLIICSGTDEGFVRGLYIRYSTRCDYIQATTLVRYFREHEEEVVADFRERLGAGGTVLLHEDAAFSAEDVERINASHGTDIRPDEVADFLERNAELTNYFVINEKKFIFVEMPQDQPDTDGATLEPNDTASPD